MGAPLTYEIGVLRSPEVTVSVVELVNTQSVNIAAPYRPVPKMPVEYPFRQVALTNVLAVSTELIVTVDEAALATETVPR